ncbi:MAG: acetolactate synthase small subunit [bacterium]|nr:acetolactate synthase small subunit [bacterium]
MSEEINSHTIAVLVENEFGVLARVAGMFAGRGFNIDALSVAPTPDPKVSRITLVTHGNEQIIEQILKQLNRLVDVLKVVDLSSEDRVRRELMLVKVRTQNGQQDVVEKILKDFRGTLLEQEKNIFILEFIQEHLQNDEVIRRLGALEILETARSGNLAMQKGKRVLSA